MPFQSLKTPSEAVLVVITLLNLALALVSRFGFSVGSLYLGLVLFALAIAGLGLRDYFIITKRDKSIIDGFGVAVIIANVFILLLFE